MRASLQHLVDLKRAGHSPRFVELIVHPRSDRVLAQPATAPPPVLPNRGRPRAKPTQGVGVGGENPSSD